MTDGYVWAVIVAAGLATHALRLVPLVLIRLRGGRLPPALLRGLGCAGFATLGSLIATAVFRGPREPGLCETAVKCAGLLLAFVTYRALRKGIPSLAVGYACYVLLCLAVAR